MFFDACHDLRLLNLFSFQCRQFVLFANNFASCLLYLCVIFITFLHIVIVFVV